jgi:hypothetical protein
MMICMATDPWQIKTVEHPTMVVLIIATDKPHVLVYEADVKEPLIAQAPEYLSQRRFLVGFGQQ